ncbi:MAG: YciI family protein, partial [Propionibacteriaceae bacterium]
GPERTTTVRVRDGQVLATDGPFAEVKEHLAGYDVVECATYERAVEIASRIPDAQITRIEIRPIINPGEE